MQIDNLKKVSLAMRAGEEQNKYNLTPEPVNLDFIYGVASEGLCNLEAVLNGKEKGEIIHFDVVRNDAREKCGHLLHSLLSALGIQHVPEVLLLEMEVADIREAESREVVQAMSKSLGHSGCGGGCDCGCG